MTLTDPSNILQPSMFQMGDARRKLVKIPVDSLPSNDELLSPAPSREFVQDIYLRKLLEPIEVSKISKSNYFVIAGRRRIKAFRILAETFPSDPYWQSIDAIVNEVTDESAILAMSAVNNRRTDNPLTDLEAINYVLKVNPSATIEQIATATGMPQGRVKKRLGLKKLVPELFDAFVAGRMTSNVADAASKLPSEYQNKLLPKLTSSNKGITLQDVTDTQRVRVQNTVDSQLSLPDMNPNMSMNDFNVAMEHEVLDYTKLDIAPSSVYGWSVVHTEYNHLASAIQDEDTIRQELYILRNAHPKEASKMFLCKIVIVED
jgi:ParB/RepB/Spo0J family partition protein